MKRKINRHRENHPTLDSRFYYKRPVMMAYNAKYLCKRNRCFSSKMYIQRVETEQKYLILPFHAQWFFSQGWTID